MLATRNLLYTAVTRGKRRVVIVGAEQRFYAMIENDMHRERWSALEPFLAKAHKAEELFAPAADSYQNDDPAADSYPYDASDTYPFDTAADVFNDK
jgi:hypothetical protein